MKYQYNLCRQNLMAAKGISLIAFLLVTFLSVASAVPTNELIKKGSFVDANTRKIKGKVADNEGNPLPGATVKVEKTSIGTVTDFDGNFTLDVPDSATALVVSFMGFESQTVSILGTEEVNVVLGSDETALKEMVVIGYGTQEKTKVTGAVSKVKSEELNSYAAGNFSSQLSGKAAGVAIHENTGQPGSESKITIRGTGTLTAGTSPLIVVDGFPLTEGSGMSSINPQDIESIDVLRDAASASVYGSRAANGVIFVTTKKGKDGKAKVVFSGYQGIQQRADKTEFVDAYDAAEYFTEARDWGYVSKDPANRKITDDRDTRLANGASKRELRLNYVEPYLNKEEGLTNTDWLDEVFRIAPMSNYSLSISGGNGKNNYYVSGNYFNQDGIVKETGYKRFNGTMKLNSKLAEWVDFGVSLNPSYSTQKYFNEGDWSSGPLSASAIAYPFFAPNSKDGSLAIGEQIAANTPEDGALGPNPVAIYEKLQYNKNIFRTFGNAFFNFKIADGLSFKTMLGGDYQSTMDDYFNPSDVSKYRNPAPKPAQATETKRGYTNVISENTLRYK